MNAEREMDEGCSRFHLTSLLLFISLSLWYSVRTFLFEDTVIYLPIRMRSIHRKLVFLLWHLSFTLPYFVLRVMIFSDVPSIGGTLHVPHLSSNERHLSNLSWCWSRRTVVRPVKNATFIHFTSFIYFLPRSFVHLLIPAFIHSFIHSVINFMCDFKSCTNAMHKSLSSGFWCRVVMW